MSTISLDDIWTRFKIGGDPRAREALIDNYGYLVKITATQQMVSACPLGKLL